MDKDQFQIDLQKLQRRATSFSTIDGSCVYAHFSSDMNDPQPIPTNSVYKFEGSLFLVLVRGHIDVSLNYTPYEADGPCVMFFSPGNTVELGKIRWDDAETHMLYMTPSFLHNINVSFSAISGVIMTDNKAPIIELNERELAQVLRFMKLMHNVMLDDFNIPLCQHTISSLMSALIYQLTLFVFKRIGSDSWKNIGGRRGNYVRDFMRLVHQNFTKERSVLFYASKLCVSPKYLSILMKECTGHSAAQWIDHFVIMEAKNMLRFSDKNVQQVAYALNFMNQSAFGKYFKHLTGFSPTEFQKQG